MPGTSGSFQYLISRLNLIYFLVLSLEISDDDVYLKRLQLEGYEIYSPHEKCLMRTLTMMTMILSLIDDDVL